MSDRPCMDPRLAARLHQKKERLDRYRPLPRDTVQRLNADLKVFITYPLSYLSWLARQGRIDAMKRNGRWYSTPAAIAQYQAEAEEGKKKRGRPPSRS